MSARKSTPTAVVTGASSGIGKAICESLLDQGWNVCLIARSTDKMQEIVSKCKNQKSNSKVIQCDLTGTDNIIEACQEINKWSGNHINLLVNNAGGHIEANETMEVTTLDVWNYEINLNLRAPFLFSKYLSKSIQNASAKPCTYNERIYDGNIINIGSAAAVSGDFCNISVTYACAKAGLNQLTKLNALELSQYKVRVNCLQIAVVETNMFANKDLYKTMNEYHPIGRIGQPKDLVAMVSFLCDKSKAGWMTGSVINFDGGYTLLGPVFAMSQNSKI